MSEQPPQESRIKISREDELNALHEILKQSKIALVDKKVMKNVLTTLHLFDPSPQIDIAKKQVQKEIEFFETKVRYVRERIVEVMK